VPGERAQLYCEDHAGNFERRNRVPGATARGGEGSARLAARSRRRVVGTASAGGRFTSLRRSQ